MASTPNADPAAPLIAVVPGDGIGPEETEAGLTVLREVRPDLRFEYGLLGGRALRETGATYPPQTKALLARSAAILFGAVGGPEFDGVAVEQRPERALLEVRKEFGLFANVRPVRVFPGLAPRSSLKDELVEGLDLIVLRELTGGLYYGERSNEMRDGVEVAIDTCVYSAPEVERVTRFGFELARGRRKKLASVDKANVLETSRLWRRVVDRIAPEYPDVELEHLIVDNAAMQLVRAPKRFDVMVMENTFGDILSDEAAMLAGSIGTVPSASVGTTRFGLYEPISGTAPDIAGKGIANPTASILSAALLLRISLGDEQNAGRIERAVAEAYARGARTADLVGPGEPSLSTVGFTDAVLAALAAVAV